MRWIVPAGLRVHGEVRPPGDKSIAHRALILGAVATGDSSLENVPPGADVASTAACLAQFGVTLSQRGGQAEIAGVGMHGLRPPGEPLDCGNSGTTMRLLAGVVAGQRFATVLDGDASLRARPMNRIVEPLRSMGGALTANDGRAPLRVSGQPLRGIDYSTPVPSAQVKSCVLLAGLWAEGQTTVREAVPTRDHSERMLRSAGVDVQGVAAAAGGVVLTPPASIEPLRGAIPGDASSAFYWAVAVLATRSAAVKLRYVGLNPGRIAAFELLREWGAAIDIEPLGEWAGEPFGDISVQSPTEALRGGVLAGGSVAAMIDELPALALLGPLCAGGVEVRDAGELRVKESDRIASTVAALRGLGVEVTETSDGLVVPGGQEVHGGEVCARGDHRIALAATALAPAARTPVVVDGAEAAAVSYPGFLEEMLRLAEGRP